MPSSLLCLRICQSIKTAFPNILDFLCFCTCFYMRIYCWRTKLDPANSFIQTNVILNSKPFPLDLSFSLLLSAILNSCYSNPFFVFPASLKKPHSSNHKVFMTSFFSPCWSNFQNCVLKRRSCLCLSAGVALFLF